MTRSLLSSLNVGQASALDCSCQHGPVGVGSNYADSRYVCQLSLMLSRFNAAVVHCSRMLCLELHCCRRYSQPYLWESRKRAVYYIDQIMVLVCSDFCSGVNVGRYKYIYKKEQLVFRCLNSSKLCFWNSLKLYHKEQAWWILTLLLFLTRKLQLLSHWICYLFTQTHNVEAYSHKTTALFTRPYLCRTEKQYP